MSAPEGPGKSFGLATRLVAAGREQPGRGGGVNPPIQRASTLLFPDVESLYGEERRSYGLDGMEAHDALARALIDIEGGAGAQLVPSGLAAITMALMAALRPGGEVLVTDSAYGPTRRFCDGVLAASGVATRYYDPRIGAGIAELLGPRTCAIVLESPGSLTFEVQDIPAITAAAKAAGVVTILDNTWSAGVYLKPFDLCVDYSIQALTKYQAGHADVLLGAILARTPELYEQARQTAKAFGVGVGSAEDAYLCLRGLRTMPLRLEHQSAAGLKIARWLEARPEVAEVLHPALPSSQDHALWARDFTGAAGLFGVVLKPLETASLDRALAEMAHFSMGFSWGGFESLIIPCNQQLRRTATPWAKGPLLRLSIGLEDPDDLIADLAVLLAKIAFK